MGIDHNGQVGVGCAVISELFIELFIDLGIGLLIDLL